MTGTCPTPSGNDGACYAPHGAVESAKLGVSAGFGGYTLTQAFNNRLQPSTIQAVSPSTTLLNLTYNFYENGVNNGNVISVSNNLGAMRSQSFSYDELNRIQTFDYGDCANRYEIDLWANLNKMLELPGSGKPPCDYLDQMANEKNQFVGFTHDAAGNLLNDGSSSYTYDAENRLTTAAGVTYTYDGDGRRVMKSNGWLYWYGLGGEVLWETNLTGGILRHAYVYFNGQRVARYEQSGTVFYYFQDHLGSSRVIVQAGQATSCYDTDYYPYGKERAYTTTCPQKYKFTGQERDFESGLDYFGARHYSPGLGRFLQPDEFPGGPLDAFSSNDPLPALRYPDQHLHASH